VALPRPRRRSRLPGRLGLPRLSARVDRRLAQTRLRL